MTARGSVTEQATPAPTLADALDWLRYCVGNPSGEIYPEAAALLLVEWEQRERARALTLANPEDAAP